MTTKTSVGRQHRDAQPGYIGRHATYYRNGQPVFSGRLAFIDGDWAGLRQEDGSVYKAPAHCVWAEAK